MVLLKGIVISSHLVRILQIGNKKKKKVWFGLHGCKGFVSFLPDHEDPKGNPPCSVHKALQPKGVIITSGLTVKLHTACTLEAVAERFPEVSC